MTEIFPILIIIAMLAVLGVLAVGIVAMARGGEFNARHSNNLMRLRVGLQFVALILIMLALLFAGR